MAIRGVDHITLRTADLDLCRAFYCGVLGLDEGYRPPFAAPGAWFYAGDAPVVHVSLAGNPAQGTGTGAVDHVAFAARGHADMCARLAGHGISFRTASVPGGAARQIFVRDPDGVLVELNFAGET